MRVPCPSIIRSGLLLLALLQPGVWLGAQTATEGESEPVTLEAFIVREGALQPGEALTPLSLSATGMFPGLTSASELPRSLTALSPEAMERLGVRSWEDLNKAGAGLQRINYFGLAGTPFIRGARAGTYFNGMLRAYQRNEMPVSFGSTESLQIVKGPAPAQLTPTLVGGYVNLLPKAPYVERQQAQIELTVGRWELWRVQVDFGQPFLLLDRPAAVRVSLVIEDNDTYYAQVDQSLSSLYGALKIQLGRHHTLQVGGELYRFESQEVPGVNRPTQRLIDEGRYVVGEPAILTAPDWRDTTVRPLLSFPLAEAVNPALHALAVPGDLARDAFTPAQLATLIDLNDAQQRAALYQPDPGAPAGRQEAVAELLAQIPDARRAQDAYVYTPEFFAAGGEVLTAALPRDRVLADARDFADADNALFFADLTFADGSDFGWELKAYAEALNTGKRSTYGFAFDNEQSVGALRWTGNLRTDTLLRDVSFGAAARASTAQTLQDFDAEPFSRRDLSRASISRNSLVLAGWQTAPATGDTNFWSTFGGASERSELYQLAAFASARLEVLGDSLQALLALRVEEAWWDRSLPSGIDNASEALARSREASGSETLVSGSASLVQRLGSAWRVYATGQWGRALAPGDGGTISGPDSFTDVVLYEGGIKFSPEEAAVLVTLAGYHWSQSVFSTRDQEARPLQGKGLELEAFVELRPELFLQGTAEVQRVTFSEDAAAFGAVFDPNAGSQEAHWALNGGRLTASPVRDLTRNPDRALAGYPEWTAQTRLLWQDEAGWRGGLGVRIEAAYWNDIERNLRLPGRTLVDLHFGYEHPRWQVLVRVENALEDDGWVGQDPYFAGNTLVTAAPPRFWEVRAQLRF